jgi:hypothetical protein
VKGAWHNKDIVDAHDGELLRNHIIRTLERLPLEAWYEGWILSRDTRNGCKRQVEALPVAYSAVTMKETHGEGPLSCWRINARRRILLGRGATSSK